MLSPSILNPFNNFCCSCIEDDVDNNNLIDDDKTVSKPIKIGKSYLLYGKRKSIFPFHCLVGPDWPMILLTYMLIVVVNAVVLGVISPLGWIPVMIGLVTASILLTAYTITVFSDPGIIYKNDYHNSDSLITTSTHENQTQNDIENLLIQNNDTNNLEANEMRSMNNSTSQMIPVIPPINTIECGQCKLQRPYTAVHCSYCKVCIDGLDHHCPWSGKCIGKKNLRVFYLFTGFLSFQIYYLLGAFLYYIVSLITKVPVGSW